MRMRNHPGPSHLKEFMLHVRVWKRYCSVLQAMTSSSAVTLQTKPPNVLVLSEEQWRKNTVFCTIKERLTACLDGQRYAVYPLSPEEAIKTPWKENCCLLVVPSILEPETFTDDLLHQLGAYIEGGGALLSMHSTTNGALNFHAPNKFLQSKVVGVTQTISQPESTVPIKDIVVQTCALCKKLPHSFSGIFPSLQQKSLNVLAKMKPVNIDGDAKEVNDEECVDCICHVRFMESSGQAVLSHIDMLGSSREASISEMVELKRDARRVSELLQMVLGEIGMMCTKEESIKHTPSYLICSEQLRAQFNAAIAPLLKDDVIRGSEVDIEIVDTDEMSEGSSVDPLPCPAANKIVLLTRPSEAQLNNLEFDVAQYMRCLRTGHLGRTLLYTAVIGSTQTMLTGNLPFSMALKTGMGVVCVARQQTQGRGRHDNVWLSPKGCLMFSTAIVVQPQSRLHGRLSLIQQIVAVSVVSAIRTVPGYEELPVGVKWPNDIYYRGLVKLGGVIITSFSGGSSSTPTTAIVGCGVNVCNRYPTMSINDCIQLYNNERGVSLPLFTVEALLALVLNRLERYLCLFESDGMPSFESDYYQYWVHSNSVVKLASRGDEEVVIVGISEYGYLQVRTQTGELLTLQPDGNSFDIIKNLIVMK